MTRRLFSVVMRHDSELNLDFIDDGEERYPSNYLPSAILQ